MIAVHHPARRRVGLLVSTFARALTGCGAATYDGTWSGAGGDGLHVHEVVIEKNEFPCGGNVAVQVGTGAIIDVPVTWEQADGRVVGRSADGAPQDTVTTLQLSGGALAGSVRLPFQIGNLPKNLSFTQFTRRTKG